MFYWMIDGINYMKNINLSSCDNYNLMDDNFLNYYFDFNVMHSKELLILILLTIITLYHSIISSTNAKYQTLTIMIVIIGGDHQIAVKFINANIYTDNYDVKICLLIIVCLIKVQYVLQLIIICFVAVIVFFRLYLCFIN